MATKPKKQPVKRKKLTVVDRALKLCNGFVKDATAMDKKISVAESKCLDAQDEYACLLTDRAMFAERHAQELFQLIGEEDAA